MTEPKSETQMDESNCSNERCKRKTVETNIDSLPDDVVFDIFFRLSIQEIYESPRLVCQRWYRLIKSPKFMYSHLRRSTPGLLVVNHHHQKTDPTFVAMRGGRVETSKLSYKSHESSNIIVSSCNGLVLEEDFKNIHALYITNLATKQRFALPPLVDKKAYDICAIAYAANSMEYKVVCTFYDRNSESRGCAILTVGVDKSWRKVSTEHLSPAEKKFLDFSIFTSEGCVHFAHIGPDFCSPLVRKARLLTLDVETEIITPINVPLSHDVGLEYYYFSAGDYISLFIASSKCSWEFWELKPKEGEWNLLSKIDLEAQNWKTKHLGLTHDYFFTRDDSLSFRPIPVGWLKFKEVLVFKVRELSVNDDTISARFYIAYNIHTREMDTFVLNHEFVSFLVHTNSLVWLDG